MPQPAEPPPPRPSEPAEKAPPGSCDTHIHMLAAPGEFPLWDKRGEDPAEGLSFEDFLARYRTQTAILGIERTVVVHSILFGTDNAVTLAAVKALGPETTRAIGLVTDDADEETLDRLAAGSVVGVRLNYVHGGVLSWDGVRSLAPRLAARGMHVQVLMNAHHHMAALEAQVRALPVPVVFDHVGWPDLAAGPAEPGFQRLARLVADGAAYVKLSGVYRLCAAPYAEADAAVAALVAANPERCLWGSDWPHIMLADASMPDAGVLLDAFHRAVTGADERRRILVDNPAALYGFAAGRPS